MASTSFTVFTLALAEPIWGYAVRGRRIVLFGVLAAWFCNGRVRECVTCDVVSDQSIVVYFEVPSPSVAATSLGHDKSNRISTPPRLAHVHFVLRPPF